MTTEISVPDIGDFESVEIIEILVKPGDTFSKNDPVVTLESEKSSVEVPSPFAGTISALITEILPSGNFKIEGRRSVTVNNEEQIMVLRGVIRPQDINFDNTIASASIADASISLTGEGVVADEQRKGWLAKILSKVWPF